MSEFGKRYRELVDSDIVEAAEKKARTVASEETAAIANLATLPTHSGDPNAYLSEENALRLAHAMALAQQMKLHRATYKLHSGSSVSQPVDWNADVERKIYGSWDVTPLLTTLVVRTHDSDGALAPALMCSWVVGASLIGQLEEKRGMPASQDTARRVLLPMRRMSGFPIPWRAFDSSNMFEFGTAPSNYRRVVLYDGPNVPCFGDVFVMSTRIGTGLDNVGMRARLLVPDSVRSHFFDDSMAAVFRAAGEFTSSVPAERRLPLARNGQGSTSDIEPSFSHSIAADRILRGARRLRTVIADDESLKRVWAMLLTDRLPVL
jgi:hypothetical protein